MLHGLKYRWSTLQDQWYSASGALARQHRSRPNRAVVMFHSILPKADRNLHLRNNSVDQLLAVVSYLRKVGTIVPLHDWLNSDNKGEFALTFDDGLLNNLTFAAQHLAAIGVPATYFVNSPLVHGQHHIWPEVVAQYTQHYRGSIAIGSMRFQRAAYNRWFDVDTQLGLTDYLMRLPWSSMQDAIGLIAAQTGNSALLDQQRVMNAAELLTLSQLEGASIGGHGVEHSPMPLLDDQALHTTLQANKQFIELSIGKKIDTLAFPFGQTDARVCSAAAAIGYTHLIGVNEYPELPQVVRRFGFYNHQALATQLKVLSAY